MKMPYLCAPSAPSQACFQQSAKRLSHRPTKYRNCNYNYFLNSVCPAGRAYFCATKVAKTRGISISPVPPKRHRGSAPGPLTHLSAFPPAYTTPPCKTARYPARATPTQKLSEGKCFLAGVTPAPRSCPTPPQDTIIYEIIDYYRTMCYNRYAV